MGRRFQLFHPTLLGLSLLLVFTTGCVNKLRMTEPTRSLGEQLLVSTSIDRSLSELDAEAIGRLFPDGFGCARRRGFVSARRHAEVMMVGRARVDRACVRRA